MTSDNPEAVRSDSAHRGSPAGGKHTEHASDRPPQYSGTPPAKSAGGNSLLAELRKAGQSLVGRQAHAQSSQGGGRHGGDSGAEDLEAGEIAVSDDGGGGRRGTDERKRRYSAGSDSDSGQLQGSARKAARGGASNGPGGGGGGLLSRAMDDVASFRAMQQRQQQDDLDAPVALKSSPSASGDSGPDNSLDAKYREAAARAAVTVDDDAQGGGAMSTPRDGDAGGGAHGGGVKSRWMVDDDGGQVPSDDQPERKGLGYGAGQPSTAAVPSGGGLGPDSDDSDEDDGGGGGNGNAPAPSPRTIANARYDMLQECRNVDEFEKINRISEGTYGVVYKAREKKTGRLVALKMIKMEKERDGFPITSIREINVMLNFHHKNIVHVSEICVGKRQDSVFMVMELMDHDLKSVTDPSAKGVRMSRAFSVSDIKNLMLQMLEGVNYLHKNWVLHRDLKSSNILYNSKGELKICDFGLARQYGSPLKPYTHMVVTLWYRAPELLLGCKIYSTAIDIWSLGCIMGELLLGQPLMAGQSEFEQLDKMVTLLGTPTQSEWPGIKELPNYGKVVLKTMPSQLRGKFQTSYGGGAMLTEAGFDLLSQLLAWDPSRRISADDALQHPWFRETPLPQKAELMPTFAPR